ncbi:hypothetical protein VSS37_03275 [Candidatus Thiothrix sp. Deng01]|uniref:HNH nuclease domain-containing protein n=1 Tax=Candidatus Thiothrix phosphatis TaxID=3112415 RepID=A0ABU6CT38_9GAMM|nr:hypothetical protein [Candidatus Thiothrix sp. Deng01]MEB4589991.1 hypothetical protein [Candidatus Thiothrix sp. Deng01]
MQFFNIIKILLTGKRDRKAQAEWRKAVMRRCAARSVLSGDTRKLEAHHLFNVASFPVFAGAAWNGVLLTDAEHTSYHKWAGVRYNTPFDFFLWWSFHKITFGLFVRGAA